MIGFWIELAIGVVLGLIVLWALASAISALFYEIIKAVERVISFLGLPFKPRKKGLNSAIPDHWKHDPAGWERYLAELRRTEANLEANRRIGKDS